MSAKANSWNCIAIEQLLCARTIAVIFDDSELLAGVDVLEEHLVVFRVFPPSSRLGGPHDAVAFYPASLGPDEIVDGPDVG